MPINITIPTNWLTRRNIRYANKLIEDGPTNKERDTGIEMLQKIAMENIMQSVIKAVEKGDDNILSPPPVPARQNLQIQIYVKPDFGGGKFVLWIKKTDTVQHLRKIVEEEMEVPREMQRLVYLGQEFKDGDMMERYSVDMEAVVELRVRA